MSDNLTQIQAFKLKGRLYTFTVLQVLHTDPKEFLRQLDETIIKAPKLFNNTPVVFDLTSVQHLDFDLLALLQSARTHRMIPVAIQGSNAAHESLAKAQGLAILHASATQDRPIEQEATSPIFKSKLVTTPVRSGQQCVAKNGDLIVISAVNHGAELLADGNIHIYGALRGKAIAGMSGDKGARIFCQSLEAELVSIAGFYRLSDAIEPYHGPCQIYLLDEHIHIEPL